MLKLTLTQKQISAFTYSPKQVLSRPAMEGVYVDGDKLVATDGHVLLIYPCVESDYNIIIPISCFPKKKGNYTIVELEKQVADIVGIKLTVIEYSHVGITQETRIENVISEQYPNYKNVIPSPEQKQALETICVNPIFLAKFSVLHEQQKDDGGIQLTFHGVKRAITVTHDEFTGLIMPTTRL
jgi:hypothetical protein